MNGLIAFYILGVLGATILSLAVMLRNRKPVFVLFGFVTILLSFWLSSQLWIDANVATSQIGLSVSILLSSILAPFVLLFSYSYPAYGLLPRKYWWLLAPPLLFIPFTFSWLMIGDSRSGADGFVFDAGPLYPAQTFVLLFYVLVSMVLLVTHIRGAGQAVRRQIYLLFVAFIIALSGSILAGVVFQDVLAAQYLRPLSLFIMTIIIGYAIIQHGLFDIRLAIVRSLNYALFLAAVAALYGLLVLGIVHFVLGEDLSAPLQLLLAVMAAVIALSSSYVKGWFDHVTNRIFYRDNYDPREVLDSLNQTFISTTTSDKLLIGTAKVLSRALKSGYIYIDTNPSIREDVDPLAVQVEPKVLDILRSYMAKHHIAVLVVDDIPAADIHISDICADNNISMFSEVSAKGRTDGDVSVFIALGPKRTGGSYTPQDQQLISTALKGLFIAIQNVIHFEQIQRFNETLQVKVEEATRQMRRTNEKLKALDETKDDFISMASHQLRTPLTSIKGYLSMVLEGDAGNITELQRKMLEQAFTSSQRMTYLISDLLNVSRLKTGKFLIDRSPVNLAKMVQQEVAQLTEGAKSRNVSLKYVYTDSFPELPLDETKTRQVIMNFVDNAIYYTPSGGSIEIKTIDHEKNVEVTVTDTGIGVPKALQHHLFTKFYRAPNAKHARPDGTGLGLFMAKKAIVAQGGAIIFKSEEGKGSTFGFSFPKSLKNEA